MSEQFLEKPEQYFETDGFPRLPVKFEDFPEDEDPGYHLSEEGYLLYVFKEARPRNSLKI